MADDSDDLVQVAAKVPPELRKRFMERAREQGHVSLSEWIRATLIRALSEPRERGERAS